MIQLQPYGVPRQFPNHRFIPDGGMIACSRHVRTDTAVVLLLLVVCSRLRGGCDLWCAACTDCEDGGLHGVLEGRVAVRAACVPS